MKSKSSGRVIALLLLCCALAAALTLTGCKQQSGVDQTAKNGNGTPAVNLPDEAVQASSPADDEDIYEQVLAAAEGDVVEIREKMFVAQSNDIYFNADNYLGKTIKYEGLFNVYEDPETGNTYYSVIRYGPGCCGVDANAGFEVRWDGGYPLQDEWVEAVGVLEEYKEGLNSYLRLNLTSLNVLEVRGAEYVSQ
jgi:uncharacterized membrane protein YcgQ (UPF0703/DUF1980 family)